MPETRGLGKGIRALIPEGPPPQLQQLERKTEQFQVPLQAIQLNRFQPRQKIDELKVQELANSIQESGLIYPLLVRKTDKSGLNGPVYELIAGERRYRALRLLGRMEAPVIVREVSDRKALELSLIENLQREELNPIEEATAYQRLLQEFGLTQEEVAAAMGKDRATVANTLRLLKLALSVREEVSRGRLTLGHARALLAVEIEKEQMALAQRVIAEGLSVRQVEGLVRAITSGKRSRPRRDGKDPHLAAAEQKLQRALGTNVRIDHGRSRGWIRIAYYSPKDLDRVLARLTHGSAQSAER